jgi:hypothetical protein
MRYFIIIISTAKYLLFINIFYGYLKHRKINYYPMPEIEMGPVQDIGPAFQDHSTHDVFFTF